MRIWRMVFVAFLFIGLTGCSLITPVNNIPSTKYTLTAIPNSADLSHQKHQVTLLVNPLQANPAYDTAEMAYTTQAYQLSWFSKSYWAETPAQMLHPLIVQTLQNSKAFKAIVTPPFNSHYDAALNVQLLSLQQDFSQHPSQVQLKLRAQLINAKTGEILATRDFCETEPAPQDTPYGGVIAANQATAKFLHALTIFVTRFAF